MSNGEESLEVAAIGTLTNASNASSWTTSTGPSVPFRDGYMGSVTLGPCPNRRWYTSRGSEHLPPGGTVGVQAAPRCWLWCNPMPALGFVARPGRHVQNAGCPAQQQTRR